MAVVTELIENIITENARVALNQDDYHTRYAALVERLNTVQTRLDEVLALAQEKRARGKAIDQFITELSAQKGLLTEFNERLWHTLVEYGTAGRDGTLRFVFKDGSAVATPPR